MTTATKPTEMPEFRRKPNFGPGSQEYVQTATNKTVTNRKEVAERLRALMGQPGERRLAVSLRTGWHPEARGGDGLTLTDILEALEEG